MPMMALEMQYQVRFTWSRDLAHPRSNKARQIQGERERERDQRDRGRGREGERETTELRYFSFLFPST